MKLKHKMHSMNDDATGASVNPDDEKTTSSASSARSFLFLTTQISGPRTSNPTFRFPKAIP